jgi:hypothetical protein
MRSLKFGERKRPHFMVYNLQCIDTVTNFEIKKKKEKKKVRKCLYLKWWCPGLRAAPTKSQSMCLRI